MTATLLHTHGKLRVPVLVMVLGLALLGIAVRVVVVQAQGLSRLAIDLKLYKQLGPSTRRS